MKAISAFKPALVIAAVLISSTAWGYGKEVNDGKEDCKKPKFTDVSFKPYLEADNNLVPPEAELSFKTSAYVDPTTIRVTAKKQPLEYTVESNSSFHKVKFKLPASLNGQFVRLDVRAVAVLGCDEVAGWLIKVADKDGAAKPAEAKKAEDKAEAAKTEEAKPAEEKAGNAKPEAAKQEEK